MHTNDPKSKFDHTIPILLDPLISTMSNIRNLVIQVSYELAPARNCWCRSWASRMSSRWYATATAVVLRRFKTGLDFMPKWAIFMSICSIPDDPWRWD